jgi:hypothetical protein
MAYKMTDALMRHRRRGGLKKSPNVEVSVYVPSSDEPKLAVDDKKWLKKDIQRAVEKVARYEKVLHNWVPEDIAAKAKKEVEQKLAEQKLHVREMKARLKIRS